jgi:putative heme-binding domain-containing protein
LEKDGSTYFAKPGLTSPDRKGGVDGLKLPKEPANAKRGGAIGVGEGSNFLLANDAWFMPVAQKVGPDGCMYILDWYDRYHCYQDANRDPSGIDRLQGRLYRVVYKDYKPAGKVDLKSEDEVKLVARLGSPNVLFRELAQRNLAERMLAWDDAPDVPGNLRKLRDSRELLMDLAEDRKAPRQARLHAFLTLANAGMVGLIPRMMKDPDPVFRAFAVRLAVETFFSKDIKTLIKDDAPQVQLQLAIAAGKLRDTDPLVMLFGVLARSGDDKLIPHIVWQNLHPLLEKDGDRFLALAAKADLTKSPGVAKVLPRAIDRILGNPSGDPLAVLKFIQKLVDESKAEPARLCLAALTVKVQNNELAAKQLDVLRKEGKEGLTLLSAAPEGPLGVDATILLAALKDDLGIKRARGLLADAKNSEATRVRAMRAIITAGQGLETLFDADVIIAKKQGSVEFRGQVLDALAGINHEGAGQIARGRYKLMEPELQPKAIEMLTQRPIWAKLLFADIADKKVSKDVININQARRLLATKDAELIKLVEKHWGIPRDGRNPEREKLLAEFRELYKKTPGDPKAGQVHFKKICAQCHKIYGEGVEVGPDITSNGRADFEQMLSNVFDPSLVIGVGYNGVIVNTKQGQTLTGLLVEDNAQRVVLKVQGGELKTIARKDVEEQFASKLSMMPEDLEKQLRPQEIVDLLSYLSLDRPPDDPKAKRIPGTPEKKGG